MHAASLPVSCRVDFLCRLLLYVLVVASLLWSAAALTVCPVTTAPAPSAPPLSSLLGDASFVRSTTTQLTDGTWEDRGVGCVNVLQSVADFTVGQLTAPYPANSTFTWRIDVGCVGGPLLAINDRLVHDRQLPGTVANITGAAPSTLRQAVLWSDGQSIWDVDLLDAIEATRVYNVSCYDLQLGLPPADASCAAALLPAAADFALDSYSAVYGAGVGLTALELQRTCVNDSVPIAGVSIWWCQLSPNDNVYDLMLAAWTPLSFSFGGSTAPQLCLQTAPLPPALTAASTVAASAALSTSATLLSSTSTAGSSSLSPTSATSTAPPSTLQCATGSQTIVQDSQSHTILLPQYAGNTTFPIIDAQLPSTTYQLVVNVLNTDPGETEQFYLSDLPSLGNGVTSAALVSQYHRSTLQGSSMLGQFTGSAASPTSTPGTYTFIFSVPAGQTLSFSLTYQQTGSSDCVPIVDVLVPVHITNPLTVCYNSSTVMYDSEGNSVDLPQSAGSVSSSFVINSSLSSLGAYHLYVFVTDDNAGEVEQFWFTNNTSQVGTNINLVSQLYSAAFETDSGVPGRWTGTSSNPTTARGAYSFVFDIPAGTTLTLSITYQQTATTYCVQPATLTLSVAVTNAAAPTCADNLPAVIHDNAGTSISLPSNGANLSTSITASLPAASSASGTYQLDVFVANPDAQTGSSQFYFDSDLLQLGGGTNLSAQYYSSSFTVDAGVMGQYSGSTSSPTVAPGAYTFVFTMPVGQALSFTLTYQQTATTECVSPVIVRAAVQITNAAPVVCRTGEEIPITDSLGNSATLPLGGGGIVNVHFSNVNPSVSTSPYLLYVEVNSVAGGEVDQFYLALISLQRSQLAAQYYSPSFTKDDGALGDYVGNSSSPTAAAGMYTFVFDIVEGDVITVSLNYQQTAHTACSGSPVSLSADITIANPSILTFTDYTNGWSVNLDSSTDPYYDYDVATDPTVYTTGSAFALTFRFGLQWGTGSGIAESSVYGFYLSVQADGLELTAENNAAACVPSGGDLFVAIHGSPVPGCNYTLTVPPNTAVSGYVQLDISDGLYPGILIQLTAPSVPSLANLSAHGVGIVAIPSVVPGRVLPTVGLLADGGVLLLGGWTGDWTHQLTDLWASDKSEAVWTNAGTALLPPAGLVYFGSAVGDGCATIVGGQLASGRLSSGVYTACLVPGLSPTWYSNTSRSLSTFSARLSPMLVYYNASCLMLFGGYSNSYSPTAVAVPLNDVWSSSDAGFTWLQLTPAASFQPRGGAAVTTVSQYTGGDAIVFAGGSNQFVWSSSRTNAAGLANDVWLSTVAGSFTSMSAAAPFSQRAFASMSSSASLGSSVGQLLLLSGGVASDGTLLGDCWVSADGGFAWRTVPLSDTVPGSSVLWLGTSLGFFGSFSDAGSVQPLHSERAAFNLRAQVMYSDQQGTEASSDVVVPLLNVILPAADFPTALLQQSIVSCTAGLLCPSLTSANYTPSANSTWSISCPYTAQSCICLLPIVQPLYWVVTPLPGGNAELTCTQDQDLAADHYVFHSSVFPPLTLAWSGCVNNTYQDAPASTWCTADYFANPGLLRNITYTLTSAEQTWNNLAVCSPLPPPAANNGTLTVSVTSNTLGHVSGEIKLTCPDNTVLIGPSTSTCLEYDWSALGTCVQFAGQLCRVVQTELSNIAQCAVNEIVIGGGGLCVAGSYMYENRPDDSLQAWRMSCTFLESGDTVLTNRETYTEALCCLADQTTFLDVPVAYTAQLSSQSPLLFSTLPSSSLQLCERYTATLTAAASCPSGKQLIAGGALCSAAGWITTSTDGAYTCTAFNDENVVAFPSHVSLVCCESFTQPACTEQSALTAYRDTAVSCPSGYSVVGVGFNHPETYQQCSESDSPCAVVSQALHYLLFVPDENAVGIQWTTPRATDYGYAEVEIVYDYPNWTWNWQCCPFDFASTTFGNTGLSCPPYTPNRTIGSVVSSNVDLTNALGATWTLSCPEQYSYLNGSSTITCRSNGQWSPGSLGACELINDDQCILVSQSWTGILSSTISCPSADMVMTNAGADCTYDPTIASTGSHGMWITAVPVSVLSWFVKCDGNTLQTVTATCCPNSTAAFLASCYYNPSSLLCGVSELAIMGGGTCSDTTDPGFKQLTASTNQTVSGAKDQLLNTWTVECIGGAPSAVATVCCGNPNPLANSAISSEVAASLPAVCYRTTCTDIDNSDDVDYIATCGCDQNELALAASYTAAQPFSGVLVGLNQDSFHAQTIVDFRLSDPVAGFPHYSMSLSHTCCKSYNLCQADNAPSNIQPTSLLWAEGSNVTLMCVPGYVFAGGLTEANVTCNIEDTDNRSPTLPSCYPLPCPALTTNGTALPGPNGTDYGNGRLSAATGLLGDEVEVTCDAGYGLVGSAVLTCEALTIKQPPVWKSVLGTQTSPIQSTQPWCQAVTSPLPVLSATFPSQYAYTVSWTPFNFSTLPSANTDTVQWNLTVALVFPLPSQLSASNAAESGLFSSFTVVLPVSQLQYTIVLDQYRHIEGTLTSLQLFAFNYSSYSQLSYAYQSLSATALVQAPCGCDATNNPSGRPVQLNLTQSFGSANSLDISFLPQSLCNPNYQITSYTSVTGSSVIPAANVSTYFPALPLLQTYYADNADSCPFFTYVATPVAAVEWQMTGLVANYCTTVAPQPICTACVPIYIDGSTVPDITTCVNVTVQWWGEVQGTVYAGSVTSQAVVPAVTIQAVITDSSGVRRSFPAVNGLAGGLVTANTTTAADGTFTINLQTPLVVGEDELTVAVTAERVDYISDTSRTVLSSQGELLQLSTTAAVVYDDSSSSTQTTVNTTALAVISRLACPAPTFTHGPVGAQPAAQSPFAFCAVLWGANSTVAYSGLITTQTAVTGGINVTSSNGVPAVAAGWKVLAVNGTRLLVDSSSGQTSNSSFAAIYATGSKTAILFVYANVEDVYSYDGQALGVGADQPSTVAHVLSATGLTLTAAAAEEVVLPGVPDPQSTFALIYDPVTQQYREVGLMDGQAPQPASPSILSSFTYVPLSMIGSVSALGCSASLPQPSVSYNDATAAQLESSLVAWWPFDQSQQEVTGHVNSTSYSLQPDVTAPFIDDTIKRYGNASLRVTIPLDTADQSDYLTFSPLPLFASTYANSSFTQLLSFSIAGWLMLDPNIRYPDQLPPLTSMPLLATRLGLASDFGLSLLWNVSHAPFATLQAHYPHGLSASSSSNIISAPLTGRQLPAYQWTHIALTWDATNVTNRGVIDVAFHLNGSLVHNSTLTVSAATLAQSSALTTAAAASYLAGASDVATSFSGWLDDIMLFNTALTPAQVLQLATYGLPTLEVPAVMVGVTYPPIPSYTDCNLTYASSINVTATLTVSSTTTVMTTRQGLGSDGGPLVTTSAYNSTSNSSVTWLHPWNQTELAGRFDLSQLSLLPATPLPPPPILNATLLPTDWSTVDVAANISTTFSQPALNLSVVLANLQLLGQLDPIGMLPAVPFLVDGNNQWVPPDADMTQLAQPVTLYVHNAAVSSGYAVIKGPLAPAVAQRSALVTALAATPVNASTLIVASNNTGSASLLANVTSGSNPTVPSYANPYVFIGQQSERDSTVSVTELTANTYLVASYVDCSNTVWSSMQLVLRLGTGVNVSASVTDVVVSYTADVNVSTSADGQLLTNSSLPLKLTLYHATVDSPATTGPFVLDTLTLTLTDEEAVVLPGDAASIVGQQSLQCQSDDTLSRITVLDILNHSIVQISSNEVMGLTLVWYSQVVPGFDFVDQSVVSVSGRVTIGFNEVVPGIEVCGMPGILIQAFAANDVQLSAALYSSQVTGNDGSFTLDVLANQPVVLAASLGGNRSLGHAFVPATFNFSAGDTAASIAGVNFVDTTTSTLSVNIVGGICEAPIGSVAPVLVVDSCGSTHFPLDQMSWAPVPYVLPAIVARFVSYTAEQTDHSGLQIPSAPSSAQLSYQSEVNSWLIANGQLQLNLTLGGYSTTFMYTAPTDIAMTQPFSIDIASESLPCTDVSAVADTGLLFAIYPSNQPITFMWHLSEMYGVPPNQLICGQVNNSLVQLWVHDGLSDDISSRCVQYGCPMTGVFNPVSGQTTVTYMTTLGDPYPFSRGSTAPPYTRDIHWGEANTANDEQYVLSLLLTGSLVYGGVSTIKIPPDPTHVLLTLRDPPGGGSFTSWESAFTVSASLTYTTNAAVTGSVDLVGKVGLADQSVVCLGEWDGVAAGVDVDTCSLVVETTDIFSADIQASAGATFGTTYTQHTAHTTTFSVQTSSDPLTRNGDGDMLLVATPTIDLSLVTRMEAVVSQGAPGGCLVTPPYDAPSATLDSTQQLNWIGVWEIRKYQIPLAQQTADGLLENNGGSAYFADSQTQLAYDTALLAALGWQVILDQNVAQHATASALPGFVGSLKLDQQYPATSTSAADSGANPDDYASGGPAASTTADLTDAAHLNSQQLVVSFNGAQGSVALELSGEYESSTNGLAKSITYSGSVSGTAALNLDAFGIAFGLTVGATAAASGSQESTTITESTSSYTMHVELADPDIGDQFDVAIKQDAQGMPVFQTLSGRSSCAPEANTVAREQLLVTLQQSEFDHQDLNSPVNTVMYITNESPFGETFGYQLWHTINNNGLTFSFNGVDDGFGSNYYQVPPGQTQVLMSAYASDGSGYGQSDVTFLIQGANCSNPYYTYTTYISMVITYDTPCSSSELAGDLLGVSSVIIGQAQLSGGASDYQYTLTIDNPNALSGDTWAANAERDSGFSIAVQWKLDSDPDTDAFWTTLQPADGALFDPISPAVQQAEQATVLLPEAYQFVALLPWSAAGTYDLRVINQCTQPLDFQG